MELQECAWQTETSLDWATYSPNISKNNQEPQACSLAHCKSPGSLVRPLTLASHWIWANLLDKRCYIHCLSVARPVNRSNCSLMRTASSLLKSSEHLSSQDKAYNKAASDPGMRFLVNLASMEDQILIPAIPKLWNSLTQMFLWHPWHLALKPCHAMIVAVHGDWHASPDISIQWMQVTLLCLEASVRWRCRRRSNAAAIIGVSSVFTILLVLGRAWPP